MLTDFAAGDDGQHGHNAIVVQPGKGTPDPLRKTPKPGLKPTTKKVLGLCRRPPGRHPPTKQTTVSQVLMTKTKLFASVRISENRQ